MSDIDKKVAFYTGFQSFAAPQAFYTIWELLAVENLFHTAKRAQDAKTSGYQCRQQALPSLEELFMILVHLHLGPFEKDRA